MRNKLSFLAALFAVGALVSGCANTQEKLGRGMGNMTEIVRLGEMRRTMEQTSLFEGSAGGYTGGFIHGLSRSLARTSHLWPPCQVTQCTGSSRKLARRRNGRALGRGAWLIQVQLGRGGLRVSAQTELRETS